MSGICPKCKKEINCLKQEAREQVEWEFILNKNGELEQTDCETIDSEQTSSFYCPNCAKEIAETTKEAIEILQGEKT